MACGSCNGVCHRFRSKLPWSGSPLLVPVKASYYCSGCKFPFDEGPKCPCCNMRMRAKPRNTAGRKKLNNMLLIAT